MGVQVTRHLLEQIATENRREPITAESRRGIAIQGNWCEDVDAASADCTKALRTESDNRCCPLGTGLLGDCGTLSQERAHGMSYSSDANAGIGWASLYGELATNRPLGTNPGDCGVGRLSSDNFRRVGNASNQATMVDGFGLEVGVANGGLVGGYEVGQLVNGFPTGGPVHPMSMFMPMYDEGLMIQHQAPPGGFGMWMEGCRVGAVDEYSGHPEAGLRMGGEAFDLRGQTGGDLPHCAVSGRAGGGLGLYDGYGCWFPPSDMSLMGDNRSVDMAGVGCWAPASEGSVSGRPRPGGSPLVEEDRELGVRADLGWGTDEGCGWREPHSGVTSVKDERRKGPSLGKEVRFQLPDLSSVEVGQEESMLGQGKQDGMGEQGQQEVAGWASGGCAPPPPPVERDESSDAALAREWSMWEYRNSQGVGGRQVLRYGDSRRIVERHGREYDRHRKDPVGTTFKRGRSMVTPRPLVGGWVGLARHKSHGVRFDGGHTRKFFRWSSHCRWRKGQDECGGEEALKRAKDRRDNGGMHDPSEQEMEEYWGLVNGIQSQGISVQVKSWHSDRQPSSGSTSTVGTGGRVGRGSGAGTASAQPEVPTETPTMTDEMQELWNRHDRKMERLQELDRNFQGKIKEVETMRAAGDRAAGSNALRVEVQKLVQGAGSGWEGYDALSAGAEAAHEDIRVYQRRLAEGADEAKQVFATHQMQARAVTIEAIDLLVVTTRLRWGRPGSVGTPKELRRHISAIKALIRYTKVHYGQLRKELKRMHKSGGRANRRLHRIRARIEEIREACSAPIKEHRRMQLSGCGRTGTSIDGVMHTEEVQVGVLADGGAARAADYGEESGEDSERDDCSMWGIQGESPMDRILARMATDDWGSEGSGGGNGQGNGSAVESGRVRIGTAGCFLRPGSMVRFWEDIGGESERMGNDETSGPVGGECARHRPAAARAPSGEQGVHLAVSSASVDGSLGATTVPQPEGGSTAAQRSCCGLARSAQKMVGGSAGRLWHRFGNGVSAILRQLGGGIVATWQGLGCGGAADGNHDFQAVERALEGRAESTVHASNVKGTERALVLFPNRPSGGPPDGSSATVTSSAPLPAVFGDSPSTAWDRYILLELYNRGKPDEMLMNKQLDQMEVMMLRHWEKEVVDAVSRLAAMGARFAEQYTSAEAAVRDHRFVFDVNLICILVGCPLSQALSEWLAQEPGQGAVDRHSAVLNSINGGLSAGPVEGFVFRRSEHGTGVAVYVRDPRHLLR